MVELMHVSAEKEAAYVASLPVKFRETYPISNKHGRWIDMTYVACPQPPSCVNDPLARDRKRWTNFNLFARPILCLPCRVSYCGAGLSLESTQQIFASP